MILFSQSSNGIQPGSLTAQVPASSPEGRVSFPFVMNSKNFVDFVLR